MIDLDDLRRGRSLFSLGCFQGRDFRLISLGYFDGFLLQQADALLGVAGLRDNTGPLRCFEFLISVFL